VKSQQSSCAAGRSPDPSRCCCCCRCDCVQVWPTPRLLTSVQRAMQSRCAAACVM
jgi:hypothetical protein